MSSVGNLHATAALGKMPSYLIESTTRMMGWLNHRRGAQGDAPTGLIVRGVA